VCFSAHDEKELRPLPSLTRSGVPSLRSSASAFNAMDIAAAMNLLVGSPSLVSFVHPSNLIFPGLRPLLEMASHSQVQLGHIKMASHLPGILTQQWLLFFPLHVNQLL
jgi:hypothetical protein